ncbi:MAG: DoxX family protein [Aureispira sp.]
MTVYSLFLYIGIAAVALTAVLGVGPAKIKKHAVIHPFVWFVQYFLGSLLIFSGLVKGVDPLGTAYKMKDYFTEFDVQGVPFMDLMQEYALPFTLVMLVLELALGVFLILGLGQRKTTWTTLLIMFFFTLLTGFNYMTGYTSKGDQIGILDFDNWEAFSAGNIRITDCGCFGDFMKLAPIETFVKDVILTILGIILVLNTGNLRELFPREKRLAGMNIRTWLGAIAIGASTWFCFQNFYLDKPYIDFRPFAEGLDLRTSKEECAANAPVVETVFVYKNKETSEEKEVNSKDLAKHSYLWETKDAAGENVWESQADKRRSKVLEKGCDSQIQYFDFPQVLDNKKYNFLVVGGDLDKADKAAFKKISALAANAERDGYKTLALYYYTGKQTIDEFRQEINGAYDFETADDKLLKTIVRANPGLLLLKDGKVIKKWHHKKIPVYDEVKNQHMN